MAMILDKPSTNLNENQELAIELYEAYEALSTNKDFETLIEKGFLDMFAKNQVGLISAVREEDQKRINNTLMGVSILENYLITIQRLGASAKAAKAEGEYTEHTGDDVSTLEDEVGA